MFSVTKISLSTLALVSVFGLAGCASQIPTTSEPAPTAQRIVVDYGDVYPNGTVVEAVNGNYEKISFDKTNELYTTVASQSLTDEVEIFGFNNEDVLEAQQFLVNVFVEDYIDNPAVGESLSSYKTWVFSLLKTRKYDNSVINALEIPYKDISENTASPTLVLTRSVDSVLPEFVKDGEPRMSDTKVNITNIDATEYDKTPYLEFSFQGVTDYRVSDKAVIDSALTASGLNNPEKLRDVLQDKVFDGEGDNAFTVTTQMTFGVQKVNDLWKIVAVESEYSFDESDYKLVLEESP